MSKEDKNLGDSICSKLSNLLRDWCLVVDDQKDEAKGGESRKFSSFWQRLQQQLENLPPEDLRVGPLAKKLTISERHLRGKFQEQFGVSLGSYLRNYRIRRAIALLTSSELTLAEIADQCGYRSVSSFCRAFQEQTGAAPSTFRSH